MTFFLSDRSDRWNDKTPLWSLIWWLPCAMVLYLRRTNCKCCHRVPIVICAYHEKPKAEWTGYMNDANYVWFPKYYYRVKGETKCFIQHCLFSTAYTFFIVCFTLPLFVGQSKQKRMAVFNQYVMSVNTIRFPIDRTRWLWLTRMQRIFSLYRHWNVYTDGDLE